MAFRSACEVGTEGCSSIHHLKPIELGRRGLPLAVRLGGTLGVPGELVTCIPPSVDDGVVAQRAGQEQSAPYFR
jgi:hypothetical protein